MDPAYLQKFISGYKARNKSLLNKPVLAVFREKHGNRYFHCSTLAWVQSACLKICRERLKEGMYDPSEHLHNGNIGLTEEQIKSMPESSHLRKEAERMLAVYARQKREYEIDDRLFKNATEAVETDNSEMALWVIMARANYEYEGFELEEYEIS